MPGSDTLTAEQLAHALGGRRLGARWIAPCPAHEDKKPSLNIDDKDGRLLVICRAGCPQPAVIDALRARGLWSSGRAEAPADGRPTRAELYRALAHEALVLSIAAGDHRLGRVSPEAYARERRAARNVLALIEGLYDAAG